MSWAGVLQVQFAVCFFLVAAVAAEVVGVTDSDVLTARVDGRAVKLQLQGIDSPERGQPFGAASTAGLSPLGFGKPVTLEPSGKDRYGRTIVDVFQAGRWVNLEMVRAGLYVKYSSDGRLMNAEAAARAARRSLWVGPTPVAPWEWRKR